MNRGQIFKTTPHNKLKKSGFDLSYTNTLTTEMARLTPVMCQEVLPGDTMKLDDVVMTRFLPMLSPVMGRIDCTFRYFFVPQRLLWNSWKDFITGGSDGTLEPSKPKVSIFDLDDNSLMNNKSLVDYLGLGQGGSGSQLESEYMDFAPILAYNLIYQEYYRDQNLGEDFEDVIEYCRNLEGQIDPTEQIESLNNATLISKGFFSVRNKCWQKDYFTSALPWAQRGPAVTIPIGNSAPVSIPVTPVALTGVGETELSTGAIYGTLAGEVDPDDYPASIDIQSDGKFIGNESQRYDLSTILGTLGKVPSLGSSQLRPLTGLADLSQVTGITINDLRLLARTQRWSEMNAVGGGRYNEQTLAHWDELIPDYTIQRPQYLGGATFPVQISEVLQTALASTSGTTSPTAQGVGQMYGHGIAVSGKPGFRKHHFCEHGWIIGLCSFMPHVSYFQGLPRKFVRFDKFDYAWPEFAHLGEQEIKNHEIYIDSDNPDGTFGYQSRYAEYKYNADEIHGDFRSTLLYWTLARKFDSEPSLNNQFMKASAINRIFAVTDGTYDHILCMCYHNLKSSRKLPKYGQPGIHII